jgi:TPR repeat protein
VDWYKKAAFQGFNLALYNLGSLYYNNGRPDSKLKCNTLRS